MKWLVLVLAVQSIFAAEFVADSKKQVVYEPANKLIWADDEFSSTQKMSYKMAVAYCEMLNLDGMTQWHLPTIKELSRIVDHRRTPTIFADFYHTTSACYWGTIQKSDSGVGFIDFSNGMKTTGLGIGQECHPRCVHVMQ